MKNKNNDKFTATWMDRCHELELEVLEARLMVAELKNILEYYYKLETKLRKVLEESLTWPKKVRWPYGKAPTLPSK